VGRRVPGGRERYPPHDGVLQRISVTTDLGALADARYVVENITEDPEAKERLYRELDAVCAADCVFAVNTSAIPITRLAGVTRRPDRVLGNHFMNPAHVMPLVEVIRGPRTDERTVATSQELLAGIGKDSLVVNDSPGFVTNRVAMLSVNEAVFLLAEGVSPAVDIDRLFRQCLGHRMGPLETADLIGLDTVLRSLQVLADEFGDPKYRPCPLLRQYVAAGWLGRKTGRGFHRYPEAVLPTEEAISR
jgi:3-hydroxybutyryl-CoA dehydrogenase